LGGADSKLVWPFDRSLSEVQATRLAARATAMVEMAELVEVAERERRMRSSIGESRGAVTRDHLGEPGAATL
jgi:hypothetical protein